MAKTETPEHLAHVWTNGRNRPDAARWLIVALLAVIAVCLVVHAGWATSQARAQAGTGARAGRIFATAGQITSNSYGLYLVDTENCTMALYQWLPNVRKLRFMAARNYTFDLQLEDYNTEVSPQEIHNLVSQQRKLKNAASEP